MAKGKVGGKLPPKGPASDVVGTREEEREVYIEHMSMSWNGHMPPPEIVRGYNDAVPNGGERVFNQFELEADHRRKMQWRGQTLAFMILFRVVSAH